MKSILARGLRRAATALNNVAERLEPSKERIQAAQEAAQAAIDRARRATVETIAEIRSEAQETAQRGQEYAATSPVKAKLYVALVFSWAVLEGFAWMALFTFLFGSTAGVLDLRSLHSAYGGVPCLKPSCSLQQSASSPRSC